jgi:hypothetical protein
MPAPRSKQPTAPAAASKTYRRRVQIVSAGYTVRVPGPTGALVELQQEAAFGDEVVLDAQEQMRLDSLGALAPVGATRESIEAESDERIEAYRSVRRGVAGVI